MIAGLGRRALQVDEKRYDGAGQQAPQVVEQRRLARAALAVEQQGRAAPVQQELLDAGADVGATYEDLLLMGQRHPDHVRGIDLLAVLDGFGQPRTSPVTTSRHCVATGVKRTA